MPKRDEETFTSREIAEGVAHDLLLLAEEHVERARSLPPSDPSRVALVESASAALAAATPFVDHGAPRKAARAA